jgi:hypothetical protein
MVRHPLGARLFFRSLYRVPVSSISQKGVGSSELIREVGYLVTCGSSAARSLNVGLCCCVFIH